MDIVPSPRVQISHPTWCTGAHDDPADHTDPRHESTPEPMALTRDDFLVGVLLRRSDEIGLATGRQEVRHPGIVLDLTALELVDQHERQLRLNPLFTPGEARRLAGTLLRLADQAEDETTEVVW